ncbi:ABC transporter permease [Streptomyces sp. NPDC090052]|uniref:ABC transporter permease n=1 Tax=unclassified Streptomyces TaxID=2593676 RepID=UPI00225BA63F|nr:MULTISPECIES: ABC transporter permease [unclassified Streptomyces]MCX4725569.1 ABC transporter permease [Streptomyces sp. NBC_01306]WSX68859.1 ABC transporter permease [Streptomyces sp. NBC_00932]
MSTVPMPLADSAIMLRRNLKHNLRNPTTVFNAVLFPIVMMLMFVKVFGGAFDVGVDYIDYATPGLLVMAISYGLGATSTAVNSDMTTGVINRFKVMDVSRGAVLTGHVIVTAVRCLVACAAIIGVAFAMGFAPDASALDWLGVIGLIVLLSFAAGWLTVALGLAAKTAESAGLAAVPLIMLPFLSSAFVPADSMGAGVRQFAEYQPFTPIIETLRGLLAGHPSGGDAIAALAWCVGFLVLGYVWAVSTFKKRA